MRGNAQRRPTLSFASLACALILYGLIVLAAGQGSRANLTSDESFLSGELQPPSGPALAGFHCPLRASPVSAALFTADPTYSEAPPTLGLDAAAANTADTLDIADMSESEAEDPFSTKLFRLIVDGADAMPFEGEEVRVVSLPGASKSVADLSAFCGP